MMNRLPTHESLKQFEKQIFTLMMKLLQIENEENVLVCLRIIIDLHKNNRPPFTPEVIQFFIDLVIYFIKIKINILFFNLD